MAKEKSNILLRAKGNRGVAFFKKHGCTKLAKFMESLWFVLLYKI